MDPDTDPDPEVMENRYRKELAQAPMLREIFCFKPIWWAMPTLILEYFDIPWGCAIFC